MKNKKIALVYITFDGVINLMSGIGTISQTFINSFSDVRRFLLSKGITIDLHLVTQALQPDALGYDEKLAKKSIKIVKENGGNVHFVVNGTDGKEHYGSTFNWLAASTGAANKVLEIASSYDQVLAYCVDVPYMYTPYFIDIQKRAFGLNNIKSLLALHGDQLSHNPQDPDINKLAWEASSIKYACVKDDIYIAKTSSFYLNHLKNHYAINNDKIIYLQSGVDIKSDRYQTYTTDDIVKYLKKYQIPLGRDLIFSVGRAVDQKGFDILLKAYAGIKEKAHLVFIASPYKTMTSNIEELKKIIKEYDLDCTAIFTLDFELPSRICQWEGTKIVAQLSRQEPFGLVPCEVKMWARKNGPVMLASRRDGYIEQITDNENGFLVDIDNIESVSLKIDQILNLPNTTTQKIRKNAYHQVIKDFDYRISIFKSIQGLLINSGLIQLDSKDFREFLLK